MRNIVREILSKRDLRHLAILDDLLEKKCTIKELSKNLRIQAKTISVDIKDINNYISPARIEVNYEGVSLVMSKNTSSRYLYNKVLTQSREIGLLELIFFNKQQSLPTLAKKLFISEMTLRRTINSINKKLKKVSLAIDIKKMKFEGTNNRLIQLMTFIMSEKYSSTSVYLSKEQQTLLDALFTEVLSNKHCNFPDLEKLRLLTFLRMQLIKKEEVVYCKNAVTIDCSSKIKEQISSAFGIDLNEKNLNYLFKQIMSDGFIASSDELDNVCLDCDNEKLFLEKLEQLVMEIAKTFSIECPNKEPLLKDLFNVCSSNTHTTCVVYNRQKNFLDNLPLSLDPVAKYLSTTISSCFENQLDGYQVNEMVYTMMTHWQNFVEDIANSLESINVGVFYDNDIEHTSFICNAIHAISVVKVNLVVSEEINLDDVGKTMSDVDLLVTNIPCVKNMQDKILCTEDFPSQQDLTNLRRRILEIYNEKITNMIEKNQINKPDSEASFFTNS